MLRVGTTQVQVLLQDMHAPPPCAPVLLLWCPRCVSWTCPAPCAPVTLSGKWEE